MRAPKDAEHRSEHGERAREEAHQYGYAGRIDRGEEVLGPRGHREAGTSASALRKISTQTILGVLCANVRLWM